jgi:hypothetical protein
MADEYVPFDPTKEPERFQFITEDNQLLWLTQEEILERDNG